MKPTLQPINIQLKRSNIMLGLLIGVSIACSLILLGLPLSPIIKLATILLIVISSTYFIWRDALLMLPWSWQRLYVNAKGELSITNNRGDVLQPALASNSFIHVHLIVLNFKRSGMKFALNPIMIWVNQENEHELRRLRVWLRWFKQAKTAEAKLGSEPPI